MNFIYILCKLIIYPSLQFFFKRKKVIGLEKLVNNKPVILYGNHNNAFLDSIVLHFAFRENIYTLTRGDVFSSKLKSYLLSQFHIMPVYRFQEGFENLQKNNETFERTKGVLQQQQKVLIFPEGNCIQEKRLRKFKKGMARIAFDFESQSNFEQGLCLQPIALNYSHPWRFRGTLEIVVGDPIYIADYKEEIAMNAQHAMNKLNADCETSLSEMMVIVNKREHENIHTELCTMLGDELEQRQKIASTLNKLEDEESESLVKLANKYTKELHALGVRDWVVKEDESGFGKQFFVSMILLMLLPVFVIGTVLNYVNYHLPYYITRKVCKNKEFYSSVNMSSAAFISLICYIIYLLISSAFIEDGFIFLLNLTIMPISGIIAYHYFTWFKKLRGKLKWLSLIRNNQAKAIEIKQLRESIIKQFDIARR